MARKPKKYRLKPHPFTRLPKAFQSHVRKTKNLIKRIRKKSFQIPEKSVDEFSTTTLKNIRALMKTIDELLTVDINWEELRRHLKYQDVAYETIDRFQHILNMLKRHYNEVACKLGMEELCEEPIWRDDPNEEYTDGTIISTAFSFMADNELPELAHLLPLVYAAYTDFATTTEQLTIIGPFRVLLESGRFLGIDQKEIDQSINNTLDAIKNVYKTLKGIGIPEYALEGPIILELGLPPLDYGGVFVPATNDLRITLKSPLGITLSANYRQLLDQLYSTPEGRIFGIMKPRIMTYHKIPTYYTIAHELGHRIYFRGLRPKAKEMWQKIYRYYGLSEEEQQIAVEHKRIKKGIENAEQRLSNLTDLYAPEQIIDNEKRGLKKRKKELKVYEKQIISSELLGLIKAHEDYGYHYSVKSFSKIKWTTMYGRSHEDEAFAEAFVTAVWPRTFIRSKEDLTTEEFQNFCDLMWYFIRSLRLQKLRRNPNIRGGFISNPNEEHPYGKYWKSCEQCGHDYEYGGEKLCETCSWYEEHGWPGWSKPKTDLRHNPDEEIELARRKAEQGEDVDKYLYMIKRVDRTRFFEEARRLWDDDKRYVDLLIKEGEITADVREEAIKYLGHQRFAFLFKESAEDMLRQGHEAICHGADYPGHCCLSRANLIRRWVPDDEHYDVVCKECEDLLATTDEEGDDIWIGGEFYTPECASPPDDPEWDYY